MRRKVYPLIDDCYSVAYSITDDWFKTCHLFDGTLTYVDKDGETQYHYNLGFAPSDINDAFHLYYGERKVGHALPPFGLLIEDKEDQIKWCAEWVKEHIDLFVKVNKDKYLKLVDTIGFKYDPISNYDMIEEREDTIGQETFTHTPIKHGVTDTIVSNSATIDNVDHSAIQDEPQNVWVQDWDDSGKDFTESEIIAPTEIDHYTTTYDDATVGRLASYDVNKAGGKTKDSTRVVPKASEQISLSESYEDQKDKKNDSYTLTRKGNIGVTTSQQMLESEREIARFNLLKEFFEELNRYITLSAWS